MTKESSERKKRMEKGKSDEEEKKDYHSDGWREGRREAEGERDVSAKFSICLRTRRVRFISLEDE